MAELKLELKLRGLPVSGTKTDLIERLKPFQEHPVTTSPNNCKRPNTQPCSTPMEVSSTTTSLSPIQQPLENMCSTPPVSPVSSELHRREDTSMQGQAEAQNHSLVKAAPVPEEQDRRLHEKERQIKELLRKLEQEQKLVEKLKMQLEVEKRSGQVIPPAKNVSSPTTMLASVKTENTVPSNCTRGSHTTPTLVKLEEAHPSQVTATPLRQFIISHQGVPQVIGQPQTLLTTPHGSTQILLPMPLANNTTTIQLPNTNVKLQVTQYIQTAFHMLLYKLMSILNIISMSFFVASLAGCFSIRHRSNSDPPATAHQSRESYITTDAQSQPLSSGQSHD